MWTIPEGHWQHAWQWLCCRRQKSPPGADIWHLRFHRERELPRLIREVETGIYRLSPMQVIRRRYGQDSLVQWSARDALVLKWVSLQLKGKLPLSPRFYTPLSGIPRGCALSPLLGASFLWYVDAGFERERGLFYVRYMDDFLFLSQRRWPVRRAVARLHQYFENTGFECHPDKTTVGRVEKGFDWLGVWFDETGPVGIAPRAWENHRTRCMRLEERSRRCGLYEEQICARVQQYEDRWQVWAEGQLRSAGFQHCSA